MRLLLVTAGLLLAACATDGGRVATRSIPARDPLSHIQLHLETEEGRSRTFIPARRAPVELTQAQFDAAMARLVVRLDLPTSPRQRLAILSWGQPGQEDERAAMTHGYYRWCERRSTPGDCLSLLDKDLYLGLEARRTLALTLSLGSVWEGAVGVWMGMVDPVALQSMVMSAMAGYLAMLVFPNPITQAAAISFSCLMVAYLGLDTVWSLLEGWARLERETEQARTFAEVREAGERFGRVMGAQTGRLLVMLATLALGSTANQMMGPPGLPGAAQAGVTAELQLGVRLAAIGQVRQVAVGQASLTLSLAPGALAMASQGTNGGENSSTPGESAQDSTPGKYRLKFIESWRKPTLTADGKILPYKGTRNPPIPISNLGRNRAGQTVTNGENTIHFDKDGFPRFEAKFETTLDDSHIGSGNRFAHYKAANQKLFQAIKQAPGLARELGLNRELVEELPSSMIPPRGYSWHHHQDVGRMQLIILGEHKLAAPHTGGMAIWGGGQ
ncbi:HNH endonuclease [Archangium lipolyticum]|uniref:HNH endonuclease n=1 Tax=Archangium lipolyticum TaxID=2970465 RepID=UPI002149AD4E|nr:HNH endonuclease [Archangium lipolyticum]